MAYDGATWVAVGSGVILASTNALDWEVVQTGDFNLLATSYGAGWFVAVGVASGGTSAVVLLTSPDGRRWAPREMGGNLVPRCLAFDGRSFLLGGAGGAILQSDPVAFFLSPSLAVRWAGELELLLTGEAGRRYRIESTADLGAGIAWVPLGAVVAESEAVRVPTAPAVGVPRQFYRARLEP